VVWLQAVIDGLCELSSRDPLTGLSNRRQFELALASEVDRVARAGEPALVLMIDIDHFKQVNDTYGHVFGDKVIRAVAQILKNNVRGRNLSARYGGEEFVVLLPDTPIEDARQIAEMIRSDVERVRIRRSSDNWAPANFSLSLGVASFRLGESAVDFVARADLALYASKNEGRNRVTVAKA